MQKCVASNKKSLLKLQVVPRLSEPAPDVLRQDGSGHLGLLVDVGLERQQDGQRVLPVTDHHGLLDARQLLPNKLLDLKLKKLFSITTMGSHRHQVAILVPDEKLNSFYF